MPRELAAAWAAGRSPVGSRGTPTTGDRPARPATSKDRGERHLPPIRLTRGVFERLVDGQRYVPWFPTAIDAPGADPVALRRHGFDVLVTGADPDVKRILPLRGGGEADVPPAPALAARPSEGGPQRVLREISEYPLPQLGDDVVDRRAPGPAARAGPRGCRRSSGSARSSRPWTRARTSRTWRRRPWTANARLYTRPPSNLDVIGVDLPIWGTSMSFMDGLALPEAAARHRRPDEPGGPVLGVAAGDHRPRPSSRNIWGTDEVPPWGTPPVQPEQLRLMTYMALAGGCRGITFVGDADLTRPAGEPLLLEMGFLNAEIDLFEGILAGNIERIANYSVFDPDPPERPTVANVNQKRMPLIKEFGGKPGLYAAAIPLAGSKGALLLVADFEGSPSSSPAQMAYHDLVISPRLPQGRPVPRGQPRRGPVPRAEGRRSHPRAGPG